MGVLQDPRLRLTAIWLADGVVGGWWDSATGSIYWLKTFGWAALLAASLFGSLCWLLARASARTRPLGS